MSDMVTITQVFARFVVGAIDSDFPEGHGLDSDGSPVTELADIAERLAEGDREGALTLLADPGINDAHDKLRAALDAQEVPHQALEPVGEEPCRWCGKSDKIAPVLDAAVETLTCERCGATWSPERVFGDRPTPLFDAIDQAELAKLDDIADLLTDDELTADQTLDRIEAIVKETRQPEDERESTEEGKPNA